MQHIDYEKHTAERQQEPEHDDYEDRAGMEMVTYLLAVVVVVGLALVIAIWG